jgi:hypothetical protein
MPTGAEKVNLTKPAPHKPINSDPRLNGSMAKVVATQTQTQTQFTVKGGCNIRDYRYNPLTGEMCSTCKADGQLAQQKESKAPSEKSKTDTEKKNSAVKKSDTMKKSTTEKKITSEKKSGKKGKDCAVMSTIHSNRSM